MFQEIKIDDEYQVVINSIQWSGDVLRQNTSLRMRNYFVQQKKNLCTKANSRLKQKIL